MMTHVFAAPKASKKKHKPATQTRNRDRDLFSAVNAALPDPRSCCEDWLPGGRISGREYDVLNPMRADRSSGSFRINIRTGRWADFATGDKGGDLVSLYAYLHGLRQIAAAEELAEKYGVRA